ncbi:MAG: glycine--tRNA ligase [Nanoarchaeota archaeon]
MTKYDELAEWASRRSIFYPASEIYNRPAGLWDFGPYGEAIRRKIINFWRKEFVQKEDMLEIYGAQIMPEDVFKASRHLKSFNDPFVECKKCKTLHRADELISNAIKKHIPEATSDKGLDNLIEKNKIKCTRCKGDLSSVKRFNMLVKAVIGLTKESNCYLRPEACQSIFLDFDRMMKTMRVRLPKGIAQVGRAFRNEISPRQSLIRQVEFSQFEAEVFFNPDKINGVENFDAVKNYKIRVLLLDKNKVEEISANELINKKIVSGKLIAYYLARTQQLYEKYGIPKEKIRFRQVGKDERPFYSKETFDLEIETSLGWIEVIANNYRTDYDLKGHMEGSGKDLTVSEKDGNKFLPHIWEISGGVDRTFFAIIDNAFKKDKVNGEERIFLNLNPKLAPYDTAILPLVNKDGIPEKAREILNILREDFDVFYDDSGSIGRRYRRLDEIGVTGEITIDYNTIKDKTITIRDRNSTKQIRVKINDLKDVLSKFLKGEKLEKLGKLIK